MALYTAKGSGSAGSQYELRLSVDEKSVDINTNDSIVDINLSLVKLAGSGYWNYTSMPYALNVNGAKSGNVANYDFRNYTTLTIYNEQNVRIRHSDDGTKSISVSASFTTGTSSLGTFTISSQTMNLTNIPRASSFSCVSSWTVKNNSSSDGVKVTITKQNSAFYDRVTYTIGSNKWTSGSLTESYFYNSSALSWMPNTSSATLTVKLETATDSGFTNIIGTSTKNVSITIDTSVFKPTIEYKSKELYTRKRDGADMTYMYAHTKGWFKFKFDVTASSGSTIPTISYNCTNCSRYSGATSGTGEITFESYYLPSISSSDVTVKVVVTVTDSRGVSASYTFTETAHAYLPPKVTANFYRTSNSSGTPSVDLLGSYVYGSWSASVGVSGGSNSIQSTSASSNWGQNSGTFKSLGITSSATYSVTSYDLIDSSTVSVTVSTGTVAVDLVENSNGVGVGFGTIASPGRVESALRIKELKGHYVHNATGQSGTGGYIKIARIHIISTYANQPIEFVLGHRGEALFSTVTIQFKNGDTSNPGLNSFYSDYTGTVAMQQETTSTWALIVQKLEGYDYVEIVDFKTGAYMNDRVTVDWIGEYIGTSLPTTGMYYWSKPTYSMNIDGYASTSGTATNATNATNDSEGNSIVLRYARAGANEDDNTIFDFARTSRTFIGSKFNNANNTWYNVISIRHRNGISDGNRYGLLIWSHMTNDAFGISFAHQASTTTWGVTHDLVDSTNIQNYIKTLWTGDYAVTSTTQTTITDGALYQGIVVATRVGTDSYFRHSMFISMAQIPTSKASQYYGWSGTSQYGGIYIWKSGNNLIFQGGISGCTGNVYGIFGIGGKA